MNHWENDQIIAQTIARLVQDRGGNVYYVGGFVRDRLLQRQSKDIDIEIHGISPHCLEQILDSLGQRIAVGESFGIYNLKGCSLDISMPRKPNLRGTGHADFESIVDPFAGTDAACRRRDFTMNAIMEHVLTGELVDPFGGAGDLRRGIIRHVSDDSFGEDPLRVLRAAQFAARFGFQVAEETLTLCSRLDIRGVARERVMTELEKALLKAPRPSVFFEVLREMEQLNIWFPELQALIGIEQNPEHHEEGDVWTHTMMVLDEAAKLRHQVSNPLGFMLGALTHDFGKAVCSQTVNGVIHAYNHEHEGIPLAKAFLRRLTDETRLIDYALNLTKLHMKPNTAAAVNSAIKVTNRLFDRAIDPMALICIALADDRGRISRHPAQNPEEFLLQRLTIFREYMARPYVMGRDLIEAGLEPGPDFSDILQYAHKLRLAGIPKDNALRQTLAFARKLRAKQPKHMPST